MRRLAIFIVFFSLFINSFSEILLQSTTNRVSLYEPFRVNIEFNGTNRGNYEIEGIENFKITGRQTNSTYILNNLKSESRQIDSLILVPIQSGNFKLRVKQNGEFSNSTNIVVVGQSQKNYQNQQNILPSNIKNNSSINSQNNNPFNNKTRNFMGDRENFLITDNIRKKDVYFGEKFLYEERFIATAPLRSFLYKERTKFGNLSAKDYTPINSDNTLQKREIQYNGARAFELLLFRGIVQGNMSGTEYLNTGVGEVEANSSFIIPSRRVAINIKPLPETNKPINFTGIVGVFDIKENWSSSDLEVGKTAILNLKLSGNVNLDNFDKIGISSTEEYNVFETLKNGKQEIRNSNNYSEKEFEIAFFLNKSGEIKIPAFTINYFNPKTEKYEIKTINEKVLTVKDATQNNVATNNSNNSNPNNLVSNNILPDTDKQSSSNSEENSNFEFLTSENADNKNILFKYLGIFTSVIILIIGIFYLKRKNIFSKNSSSNLLKPLKDSKTNEEFYNNYINYMIQKYNFNPKIHSETKLNNDDLRNINRTLELWKYQDKEFNREEIITKLKELEF